MYSFLKESHLILGVLSAGLFLILVLYYLILFFSNKSLHKISKLAFYTTMLLHLQFVMGIVYYFYSPIAEMFRTSLKMGMKEQELRFFGLEHPLMMIIFLIFIILFSRAIKKNKKALSFVYLVISFLLIYFAFPLDRVFK